MIKKSKFNRLRINFKNKKWNSKYFNQNHEELSLFIFEDSSFRRYLDRFFKLYGLMIHSYKLQRSSSKLEIVVSYYITLKTIALVKRYLSKDPSLLSKNSLLKKQLKYIDSAKNTQKIRFKNRFKSSDSLLDSFEHNINNFVDQLLENFYLFIHKSQNMKVKITFQNLNKGLSRRAININQDLLLSEILFQLRQYKNRPFFQLRDAIQILFILISKKNSAKILADFIALQMKHIKFHTHFFSFVKEISELLVLSKFSVIKGIKIIIQGRINEKLRAKKKMIAVGKVPIQTLHAQISYYQSVAYTSNGTFGIKVWICENSN